jgi:hypothetical protein
MAVRHFNLARDIGVVAANVDSVAVQRQAPVCERFPACIVFGHAVAYRTVRLLLPVILRSGFRRRGE